MSKKTFNWQSLGSEELWYLVGLITSDGCLSSDGRHINITAKDSQFLERIKKVCNLPQSIGRKKGGWGHWGHQIWIGSVDFYQFLLAIGLHPRKSKTLSGLFIQHAYFHHFLRGLIDGDGCIRRWQHPTNGGEQWSVRITSGSLRFLRWLRYQIIDQYRAVGRIHSSARNPSGTYVLKYGKVAGRDILLKCYPPSSRRLCLPRKYNLARKLCSAREGWSKSITAPEARVAKLVDAWDSRDGSAPWQHGDKQLGEFGEPC